MRIMTGDITASDFSNAARASLIAVVHFLSLAWFASGLVEIILVVHTKKKRDIGTFWN